MIKVDFFIFPLFHSKKILPLLSINLFSWKGENKKRVSDKILWKNYLPQGFGIFYIFAQRQISIHVSYTKKLNLLQ